MTITTKELPYIVEILNGVLKSRKVDNLSKFVFCNEHDFRKIDTRMLVHPLIDHTFDNAASVNSFISATEGMAVVEMEQEILDMQYEMYYSLDNLSIRIDGIEESINSFQEYMNQIDAKMNLILEKQESNFNELKNLIIALSSNNKPASPEAATKPATAEVVDASPKIVGDTEASLNLLSTELVV